LSLKLKPQLCSVSPIIRLYKQRAPSCRGLPPSSPAACPPPHLGRGHRWVVMVDIPDRRMALEACDVRFGPPAAPAVSFRCFHDPVSETKTKSRFLVNTHERYLHSELASVLHWPPASLSAAGGTGAAGHLLVPDAAFARDYIEFLESEGVELLLLGSELEALRTGARSRREYTRLRDIGAKPTRRVGVFHNQHLRATAQLPASRRAGQSQEEHAGALFATAAAWVSRQPFVQGWQLVVVSDSAAVRDYAVGAGLVGRVFSSEEYFAELWHHCPAVQTLVESVVLALEARQQAAAEEEGGGGVGGAARRTRQRRWLSDEDLAAALQAGVLVQGQLQVDEHRPEEAWVRVSKDSARPDAVDLFLPSRAHRGRSIHGDMVAVESLPAEDWGTPSFQLPRRDAVEEGSEIGGATAAANTAAAGAGAAGQGRLQGGGGVPSGRVVGVLERPDRSYVATIEDDVRDPCRWLALPPAGSVPTVDRSACIFDCVLAQQQCRRTLSVLGVCCAVCLCASAHGRGRAQVSSLREGTTAAVLAIPMDLRIPKMRLRTRRAPALANCRLVLSVDDWSVDSTYPAAHIVKVLGALGAASVASFLAAVLTEIYLCNVCSCQEVLRRNGRG
jgi:hypothetical protein